MIRVVRVAAWWAVAAVLGWLVVASLLDRLAGQGVFVAAPPALSFGGDTLAARAALVWRQGDLATAAQLSRAAVARRPVDAATLRLAGSIALARGDRSGAALMRLAGAAGWRDRETQLYWGEAAAHAGAWDVAVERAEALARVGDFVDLRRLLRPIEAAPGGRAALLRAWCEDGGWLVEDYAAWPRDDAAAMANRYAVVQAMVPHLTRADRGRLAAELIGADRLDWAFAIAAPDKTRLAFRTDRDWTPLDWNLAATPGLESTPDGSGGLHVVAGGPALLPLATRLLRLPPGTTRLDLRVEGARTDLPLLATLACLHGTGAAATPATRGYDLIVPPGCRGQTLALAVAGEEARRGADFRLYPPQLSRAAAAP